MNKNKSSNKKIEQLKKNFISQLGKCDFCRKTISSDEYTTYLGKKKKNGQRPEYPIHKSCLVRKLNVKNKSITIWRGGTPQ